MNSRKKILIVDDERDMVELLRIELEKLAFEVICAFDGLKALELARNEMPDLIVLDVMLPKKDGYQICRMLKFDEKYRHIPIILLTARDQPVDKTIGEQVSADAYITKPFNAEILIAEISKLIDNNK